MVGELDFLEPLVEGFGDGFELALIHGGKVVLPLEGSKEIEQGEAGAAGAGRADAAGQVQPEHVGGAAGDGFELALVDGGEVIGGDGEFGVVVELDDAVIAPPSRGGGEEREGEEEGGKQGCAWGGGAVHGKF